MNYFRMYGRLVEIYRYSVTYQEDDEECTRRFPTYEEAEAVAELKDGIVSALENPLEWMDGLEVADVKDTYAEALKIAEMGKEAYERQQAFKQSQRPEKLRADLDYMMLMGDN